mgnify:CR=1 FL=1
MTDLSKKTFSKPVVMAFETRRIVARENGVCIVDLGASGLVASGHIVAPDATSFRQQFENLARYGELCAFGHPVRSYTYKTPWLSLADDVEPGLVERMQDGNLDKAPEQFNQFVVGQAATFPYAPFDRALIERAMVRHGATLFDLAALIDGPGDGVSKAQLLQAVIDEKPATVNDATYAWMMRAASDHPLDKAFQHLVSEAVLRRQGAPAKVA